MAYRGDVYGSSIVPKNSLRLHTHVSTMTFGRFFVAGYRWMRAFTVIATIISATETALAASPVRFSSTPIPGMTRAEWVVVMHADPVAVMVLAPGCNGDGETMVKDIGWLSFAQKQRLILVGLSFASDIRALHDGTGYYYAAKGSGTLLLNALDRLTHKPLPILMYGFSGGAHVTARFAEWKPERVAAWCAYSAGWWDDPLPSARMMPLGMIACGEDDMRLGASLFYFKKGRAVGRPWLWAGIPGDGHVENGRFRAFARAYFAAVLEKMQAPDRPRGVWVDIEEKTLAEDGLSISQPSVTGWLPDMKLFPAWKALAGDMTGGKAAENPE